MINLVRTVHINGRYIYQYDLTDQHCEFIESIKFMQNWNKVKYKFTKFTLNTYKRPTLKNPERLIAEICAFGNSIDDADIDELFKGMYEDTVKVKLPTDPFQGIIIDDKDYWWNKRGLCPNCKDTLDPPKSMPGGYFKCSKCNWQNT